MKKRAILIGGRSKARALAQNLLDQGYRITLINASAADCLWLAEMEAVQVLQGDGTKLYLLEDAEAGDCDLAIALMPSDADNLVACQLCKQHFGVKRTISLVSDPKKVEFFRQCGVDSVVCAISTVTNLLQQQALLDGMQHAFPLAHGRVQLLEVEVPMKARVAGLTLEQVHLPAQVIVACILRGEVTRIPRGKTTILGGDTLILLARQGVAEAAYQVLTELVGEAG